MGFQKICSPGISFSPFFFLFVFRGSHLWESPAVGSGAQETALGSPAAVGGGIGRSAVGNTGDFGRLSGVCCWRLPWQSPG